MQFYGGGHDINSAVLSPTLESNTLSDKIFGGQNFRRTKLSGGQNFRNQVRFSAVLSAEILSDKVLFL